jgi:hypothetical protein
MQLRGDQLAIVMAAAITIATTLVLAVSAPVRLPGALHAEYAAQIARWPR